jgi:hypothetical protein
MFVTITEDGRVLIDADADEVVALIGIELAVTPDDARAILTDRLTDAVVRGLTGRGAMRRRRRRPARTRPSCRASS